MKQIFKVYPNNAKALFSLFVVLMVSACSSSTVTTSTGGPDGNEPSADTINFTVAANAQQEVPTNASTATASGTLRLDSATGALSGEVVGVGLTITAAHIHSGFAGSNGDVILALDVDGFFISVPAGTVLAADQQASMLSGAYYLNIHTAENPGGEIRGQLAPAGISVSQATLSGENEVPAVASAGSGTAYITLNETSGAIEINVITTGLTTPTAAHLHVGEVGASGAPIVVLTQDTSVVGNFSSAAGTVLSADDLALALNGGTYINVHTAENPGGELRGQVSP